MFVIDGIDKVWFVDATESFSKKYKSQRIKDGWLTGTVLTDD